ncbi:MAG: phosphoribosylamine--glycine ligase [Candidatus Dactylopiibacterium carminicum]|uniref:Phosphoribosylamine--glycine ligase n=1 Tax=Candidatus Dactylopiibacterium carminicum TaxID=857335 RepID=A0A272EV85_9RHOO|nr:phosphoribosylamine--glycine ligase [Candidatus Dactylopiibacterium carminicum]KAF7600142.1 phosphoribosylamine--glycine ligase [Candidatus Dactylopiibacterium carminicum]PAS94029.1 MAG: phosphoribosylamine--glycine ligase [Candidatus Dactylopiibacterium carminicum]PAS98208.1 MAG: phosphoribosylamine--glycine ligase [Candidatus Dactylopiibacterium carminicum]PAT00141.1 MAG: phosphoribosylamine--glycine ligase [Candidatus Dactylopiibacterium carminicum]
MKILVIGSGGREHALAWKLAQSPRVQKVIVAPGNAGTATEPGLENDPASTVAEWIELVRREDVALTVVGPEAPLAAGVVDAFRAEGLPIFGPTRACAQLESSKDFAKQFLVRHNIPTAKYQTFSEADAAHTYVDAEGAPIVIKADGLAAGKGVVVAMTLEEAHAAIDMMLVGNKMGDAGARVVIEEFMQGEEASFIVMADGRHALAMATSQDHKRLKDNDQGPNTGGMGAYSPAPVVTPQVHARVMREIINPTLAGMAAEGHAYTGFLYAGLMIDESGAPRVVEFNCRFGDPETQPIMMRLKTDLVELVEEALAGKLDVAEAEWDRRVALGVVLAAGGYPEEPRKGDAIHGLDAKLEDTHVFHAGTALRDGKVVASGGRVLCVTALGDSVKTAQARAYELIGQVGFEGMQYRRDIGFRAIKR